MRRCGSFGSFLVGEKSVAVLTFVDGLANADIGSSAVADLLGGIL